PPVLRSAPLPCTTLFRSCVLTGRSGAEPGLSARVSTMATLGGLSSPLTTILLSQPYCSHNHTPAGGTGITRPERARSAGGAPLQDWHSTRLNSSNQVIAF